MRARRVEVDGVLDHVVTATAEDCRLQQPYNNHSQINLTARMIRQDINRIDPKRRATLDYKKKQFATPTYKQQDYPHRLNFYEVPPTAEITLEQFEQWAIDRLKSTRPGFLRDVPR